MRRALRDLMLVRADWQNLGTLSVPWMGKACGAVRSPERGRMSSNCRAAAVDGPPLLAFICRWCG